MRLETRIKNLEETAKDIEWPDMTVHLTVVDGRRTDSPEPDRLAMIVKAGTPHGGQTYHRGDDESETDFIKRTR